MLNVKNSPYLASGDGINDDTGAIQRALHDATGVASKDLQVFLPAGQYRITKALTVPSHVQFFGEHKTPTAYATGATPYAGHDAWPPSVGGSTIYIDFTRGDQDGQSSVNMELNTYLGGMAFYHVKVPTSIPYTATPSGHQWTIRVDGTEGGGAFSTVENIQLINSYRGILWNNAGGFIRNIYGECMYRGIELNLNGSLTRVQNVTLWEHFSEGTAADNGNKRFKRESGVAYSVKRMDGGIFHGCSALAYKEQFRFDQDRTAGWGGAGTCMISDCWIGDVCDIGVRLIQTAQQSILISNCNFAPAGGRNASIIVEYPDRTFSPNFAESDYNMLQVNNCCFIAFPSFISGTYQGAAEPRIIQRGGRLLLNNCIYQNFRGEYAPFYSGSNGDVIISNNIIPAQIIADSTMRNAIIVNNLGGRVTNESQRQFFHNALDYRYQGENLFNKGTFLHTNTDYPADYITP